MKPLAGRSSRVLLVAAMSTSAFVGATATAGAAERAPASGNCHDPADLPAALPFGIGGGECDPGGLMVQDVLADTFSAPELQAVAPAVMETFKLVNPRLGECDTPPAPSADTAPVEELHALETVTETVSGTDMTEIVGVPIADALLVEPEAQVAVDGRSADTGVATAVGGVVIEEPVVTTPEQVEVVGPQTAATGGLPATGNDGSLLTMLGLAMIASGAAARFVARD